MTTLGRTLRSARKVRRLTLADVKDATGLSVSFLSDIERDVTKPSIDTLEKLAQCYQVTVNELLQDVDFGVEPEKRYQPPGFKEFEKMLQDTGTTLDHDMQELLLQVENRTRRKATTKEDWLQRYYMLKGIID